MTQRKFNIGFKALLLLDVMVLALVTLYKFNFIIPIHNEFIFSGDFIRPITFNSAFNYYIYPYVYNEHGIFLDIINPFRIPYYIIVSIIMFFTSPNIAYWLIYMFPQVFGAFLVSFSIRRMVSRKNRCADIICPLLPAIFLLLSYPVNYRPYWLFLPLIPGITVFLLSQYHESLKNSMSTSSKISLFLIGVLAMLQVHVVVFPLMGMGIIFFILLSISSNKFNILKNFIRVSFWFSFPFLLMLLAILPMKVMMPLKLAPYHMYHYNVLEFMSKNANFLRAFEFNTGFWPKVPFTIFDQVATIFVVALILATFLTVRKSNRFSIAAFGGYVLMLYFQMGYYNPLYKILADPSFFFSWIFRDPLKFNLLALGLFLFLFSLIIVAIQKECNEKNTRKYFVFVTILALLLISWGIMWSPQVKTGEILKPSRIPDRYFDASEYLNSNVEGPIIFIPISGKGYIWPSNKNLEGSFLAKTYRSEYVDYEVTTNPYIKECLTYAASTKNLELLKKFFQGVVIDESIIFREDCYGSLARHISENKPSNVIKFGENLYFISNENYSKFESQGTPVYIFSPTDYKYLDSTDRVNFNKNVVFFDPKLHVLKNSNQVELSSKYGNPSKLWSKAATNDPLHGSWHIYLERQDIENWQSDYGKGLVFTWATTTTLKIPFNIEETDTYKLLVRYFKNQKGGEIKVCLDGRPIEINTKDQLNKFVWKELAICHLEKGKHTLVLENVNGFNAVNIFALIPHEEYENAEKKVYNLVEDKRIIYIFEAESDLYRENAEISKKYGGETSNGEVLELKSDSKVWQDIEIIKPSNYRITARLNGDAVIKLDNESFDVSANNLTWIDLNPIYLTEGTHSLEIITDKYADLDVVWIYSVDANETLEDVFTVKEAPAQVINYTKIDPTLYKVKVNATKPFMLTFAESYDPLWEARVYKGGEKVEVVKSIPLYSVINGFWINETGNLEIGIRYKPQDWFELGLWISGLTFVGCVGYLFYDWRSAKRDKWTLRIRERLHNAGSVVSRGFREGGQRLKRKFKRKIKL